MFLFVQSDDIIKQSLGFTKSVDIMGFINSQIFNNYLLLP